MSKQSKENIQSSLSASQKKRYDAFFSAEKEFNGMTVHDKTSFFEKVIFEDQNELASFIVQNGFHPVHQLDGIPHDLLSYLIEFVILCHKSTLKSKLVEPFTMYQILQSFDSAAEKIQMIDHDSEKVRLEIATHPHPLLYHWMLRELSGRKFTGKDEHKNEVAIYAKGILDLYSGAI